MTFYDDFKCQWLLYARTFQFCNPVEWRLIVVNGAEAQLYIDEVGADVEATVDNIVAAGWWNKNNDNHR